MGDSSGEADRPIVDFSIPERIVRWRRYAREEARAAQKAADDNPAEAILAASLATMYLALAADADRFGELPEIPDDEVGGDE
ncbi:hypothetical protein BTO20_05960 [Mycobacterium dioxanotrophicus]|uniref:Uncharacterized protein n=1 Tax=Mycobacterium dioxanotrophicus TaxID=482462 RepID=A0A1Y0BZ50_9MYCO|nr:hypothetical protein [Mycobacterium dioxanotrophicus]ART68189.1 hypothetical protein BTO20_05960 [Mycobacterium dioxanotrophicus]